MLHQNDKPQDNTSVENNTSTETIKNLIENSQFFLSKFIHLFRGDKTIWIVFFCLCFVSLIEVYSASGGQLTAFTKHGTFLAGGLAIILGLHYIPYRFFRIFLLIGLVFSFILLLIIVFNIGDIAITRNYGTRWIQLFGFEFQPSEIAKVTLIGTLAYLLSMQNKANEKEIFYWMVGLSGAICSLIMLDNFSTAVLLFFVCFLMMFLGNVKISRLLTLAGVIVLTGVVFVMIVNSLPSEMTRPGTPLGRYQTWVNRIVNFGGASELPATSFDIVQADGARIAIANGGVFGVFPGNSTAREFLPMANSDFIYAIILEEMGLLGGAVVLLLYIILLFRGGMIAKKTEKMFPRYLVLGSVLMLSTQAFMHMAVNVGLMPVTGQPLPLISLGGTSILISSVYFGLILSVDRFGEGKKKKEKTPPQPNSKEEEKNITETVVHEIKVG